MSTQISVSSTTTTTVQKTARVIKTVPSSVPDDKPFFLFDSVGLVAPPLQVLVIPVLLWHYRQIPISDRFYSIAFPLYLCLANRYRFDTNAKQVAERKQKGRPYPGKPECFVLGQRSWFPKYMMTAASLGVVIPLFLQFAAPLPIADAAAPHLYMLVCQILMERMVNGPKFHPMLQMINPIGFSAYRMFSVTSWLLVAWQIISNKNDESTGSDLIFTWEMMHFLLALSNAFLWTYNTFVILLLGLVPPCLDSKTMPDADVSWKRVYPTLTGTAQTKVTY